MLNGWLNIYKPQHITSATVVGKIKKLLWPVKIGHTGTLDPLAEGVLPLALNEATKLASYLTNQSKIYQFTMQFGARTNTGDAEGAIIDSTLNKVKYKHLAHILPNFIGLIEQTPSIYSAIKINGQPAYKLARQGKEAVIPKRTIEIYDLNLIEFNENLNTATLRCHCSKGTYIRSLAEDLAFSLQNLAYVIRLQRLKVGAFDAKESLTLAMIQQNPNPLQQLQEKLLPIDFVLDDIPVIEVTQKIAERIRFGQQINIAERSYETLIVKHMNKIIAIGSVEQGDFIIKRVFNL